MPTYLQAQSSNETVPQAGRADQVDSPQKRLLQAQRPEIIVNVGHSGEFQGGVVAAQNGRCIASFTACGKINEVIIWDLRKGHRVRSIVPQVEQFGLPNAGLSPSGEQLAYSGGGVTELYDVMTGRLTHQFAGGFGCGNRVFSSDGSCLCLRSSDGVTVVDTTLGTERCRIRLSEGHVYAATAEFSPDGSQLLVDTGSGTHLVDLKHGRSMAFFDEAEMLISGRSFSPSGDTFLLIRNDFDHEPYHGIDVCDRDGKRLKRILMEAGTTKCAELTDGATKLLTLTVDGQCALWDVPTQSIEKVLSNNANCAAFNRSQDSVVVGIDATTPGFLGTPVSRQWLEVFDVASGRTLQRRNLTAGNNEVAPTTVQFLPDDSRILVTTGKAILSGSPHQDAGEAYVWNRASDDLSGRISWAESINSPLSSSGAERNGIVSIEYRWILQYPQRRSGTYAAFVNLSAGQPIRLLKYDLSTDVDLFLDYKRIGTSPDGELTYLPLTGGTIVDAVPDRSAGAVFNIQTGERLSLADGVTTRQQHAVAFSPDSRLVVVGNGSEAAVLSNETGEVTRVFDVRSGDPIRVLDGNKMGAVFYPTKAVAFSPSGKQLLTATDFSMTLWDAETWTEISTSDRDTDGKNWANGSYSHYGQLLGAILNDDESGWIYGTHGIAHCQFRKPAVSRVLKPWESARSVSVRPDRNRVAFASESGLGVVDLKSGERLSFHDVRDVTSVTLSHDAAVVISTHGDAWCRIWDTEGLEEICRFLIFPETEDWIAITPDGLFDGTLGARQRVYFRLGAGLDVVPVDHFFQDFYFPGLLAAIWRGERPRSAVVLGEELPPLVTITTPERSGDAEERRVKITASAVDQGGGIKGPFISHNGAKLIGAVQATERFEGGVRRTFGLDLIEGENTIEITSASADGSFESEPVRLLLRYNKSLPKSRLYLLAVGIDAYADPLLKMNYAVSDADRIANVFATRGGSLYEGMHVIPLMNESATSARILEAINSLAATAMPQDTVVVFLSGHGSLVDQNFYFLSQDFRRSTDSLEDDIRQFGLPASRLGNALAQVRALKRMIVFDTGQSGKALPVRPATRNPFVFRGAIERLGRAQGAFTMAAAAVSDKSQEVEELRHGVLSYSLLAGLKAVDSGPLLNQWIQPAGNDKVADAMELFSFASSQSRQLGKRYFGQEQQVQYSSSGMTFPVLPIVTNRIPRVADAKADQRSTEVSNAAKNETPPVSATDGPRLYVVTVGIDTYQQSALNLRYAASDAREIGHLLKTRSEGIFSSVSVISLLNEQATHLRIREALQSVASLAKPEDTLMVFMGGHGAMVGQRYYFIPYEFTGKGDQTADDIRAQAIPADEMGELISKVPARRRLMIFDTCASGGAIQLNKQGDDPFAFRSAIEQLGKDGGTFTLAAVSSTEEAQEVEELGHGILTYSLLAAANAVETGPLRDRPLQPTAAGGTADVLEWFSYASGSVPRLTRQYFADEQQVQLGGHGQAFPVLRVQTNLKESE